jgi:hypothetical protein
MVLERFVSTVTWLARHFPAMISVVLSEEEGAFSRKSP